MSKNRQQGISVPLIMLIVVIVILVGSVGWLLYDRVENNQVVTNDVKTNQDVSQKVKSVVPAGFSEYKNEEFGLKFYYPTDWGTPSTQPDFEVKWGHITAGKGIEINFANNKQVSGAIRSKNWTHDPNMGHGGIDNVVYFAPDKPYDPIDHQRDNHQVYINDKSGYFALTPLCGEGGCFYMGLVLIKNIDNNPNTNGMAFVYRAVEEINLSYTEIEVSQTDIDALPWSQNFPNSLIDQFKTINSSISNI